MVVMDLNAQTGRESMGCLSLRPAAIHIHYLGFPASTGAEYASVAFRLLLWLTRHD
jgi:predicted O-linked N-acetylglucosamine transferase (SPINDLY family)